MKFSDVPTPIRRFVRSISTQFVMPCNRARMAERVFRTLFTHNIITPVHVRRTFGMERTVKAVCCLKHLYKSFHF